MERKEIVNKLKGIYEHITLDRGWWFWLVSDNDILMVKRLIPDAEIKTRDVFIKNSGGV